MPNQSLATLVAVPDRALPHLGNAKIFAAKVALMHQHASCRNCQSRGLDSACHDRVVPVIWLVAGVLLAIAELFTLDFVLIMLAAGALAAAGTGLLDVPVPFQVVVFGVVSALGLFAVRPAIRRHLHKGADPAVMGVEALEGTEATVVEQVADGRGMVKIGGELWSARPYDATQVIDAGVQVRVVELKGATALVWKE